MLSRWIDLLLETDPDVMTGYNIINFDLPYLFDRATVRAEMCVRISVQCLRKCPAWHCPVPYKKDLAGVYFACWPFLIFIQLT